MLSLARVKRFFVLVVVVGVILLVCFSFFFPLVDVENVVSVATVLGIVIAMIVEAIFFRQSSGGEHEKDQ